MGNSKYHHLKSAHMKTSSVLVTGHSWFSHALTQRHCTLAYWADKKCIVHCILMTCDSYLTWEKRRRSIMRISTRKNTNRRNMIGWIVVFNKKQLYHLNNKEIMFMLQVLSLKMKTIFNLISWTMSLSNILLWIPIFQPRTCIYTLLIQVHYYITEWS